MHIVESNLGSLSSNYISSCGHGPSCCCDRDLSVNECGVGR